MTSPSSILDGLWMPALNAFGALVAAGANHNLYQSTDGTTWRLIGHAPYYSNAASDAVLVGVCSTSISCLATSATGASWTQRAVPGDKPLTKVFWTGSAFVAVGPAGAIATAPGDGATWSARDSGVGTALNGAAGSADRLVVVGNAGAILLSADGGATWSSQDSGTSVALHRIIWTGSEFVAVGNDATLLRSSDGTRWSRQETPYAPGDFSYALDFKDVSWSPASRLLTVVGSNGFTATVP